MATPLPSVIRVEANTNLKQIGVQPGWFVRAGSCSIWFEVQHVYDKAILVAARDPRRVSDVVSVGNFFSAINEVSSVAPPHSHWIKLDRKLPPLATLQGHQLGRLAMPHQPFADHPGEVTAVQIAVELLLNAAQFFIEAVQLPELVVRRLALAVLNNWAPKHEVSAVLRQVLVCVLNVS